jgi:hypothetical protein
MIPAEKTGLKYYKRESENKILGFPLGFILNFKPAGSSGRLTPWFHRVYGHGEQLTYDPVEAQQLVFASPAQLKFCHIDLAQALS